MPYFKQYQNGVPSWLLDGFTDPGIIIVSGTGPNLAGHALLKLSNTMAGYAHVDAPYDYPKFMSPDGFAKYLSAEGKTIWGEISVRVPNMEAARTALNAAAQQQWVWLGVAHNCVDFAVEVLNAGGANLPANMSNLPKEALQGVLINKYQTTTHGLGLVYGPQTAASWSVEDDGL
ncbi:MAG TPA: hypothetical protein VF746_07580 [Longimicrobium sp.]